MLARVFENLGPDDPDLDAPCVLEPPTQGLGRDFCELVSAGTVACLRGEGLHVDIEGFGRAEQYARRDGALIALQVVEVGRRDAELVGHLALIEPSLAPQPLQSCAEEELALSHRGNLSRTSQ